MELVFLSILLVLIVAPVALAALCWRLAAYTKRSWIVHLLFAPILLGGEWFLLRQFLTVAADDSDFAGTGIAVLLPLVVFAFAPIGYYGLLGMTVISRRTRIKTNGRPS